MRRSVQCGLRDSNKGIGGGEAARDFMSRGTRRGMSLREANAAAVRTNEAGGTVARGSETEARITKETVPVTAVSAKIDVSEEGRGHHRSSQS